MRHNIEIDDHARDTGLACVIGVDAFAAIDAIDEIAAPAEEGEPVIMPAANLMMSLPATVVDDLSGRCRPLNLSSPSPRSMMPVTVPLSTTPFTFLKLVKSVVAAKKQNVSIDHGPQLVNHVDAAVA